MLLASLYILCSKPLISKSSLPKVAQKFYSLLVLKKQQAIELGQDTTVEYGEIHISRGHRYDEVLVSSS